MKTKRTFALLATTLALSILPGCWTTSLQALYQKDDPHVIYDPALIGTWQSESDSPLTISTDPRTGNYKVEVSDEQGRLVYDTHLVQLGAYRFLDVIPVASYDTTGKSQDTQPGYIPMHSILKVSLEGDSLFLTAPNDARLCAAAKEERLSVGDCVDGDFVFTAQTPILQDYFLKHGDDLNVFEKKSPDEALRRQVAKPGAGK